MSFWGVRRAFPRTPGTLAPLSPDLRPDPATTRICAPDASSWSPPSVQYAALAALGLSDSAVSLSYRPTGPHRDLWTAPSPDA